jgi:hypothetical protein
MSIYRNVQPMLMPSFADRDEALARPSCCWSRAVC